MLLGMGALLPSCPLPRRRGRLQAPPRQLARASEDDYSGHHSSVQEGLATILQLEICKRRMQEVAEEERRHFVEKAREGMEDDLQQIRATAAARSSKDFEAALANLTSSVDALSQGLEAQKEARKAGELEFQDWKRDMAKRRSAGLFFKSLYQEKKGKPKRLEDSLDAFAQPEVQESLRRIEARRKLGKSPEELAFRRNIAIIYALTSVVLFSGLLHGLANGRPGREWQLALYAVFGVAFGASSWLTLRTKPKKREAKL